MAAAVGVVAPAAAVAEAATRFFTGSGPEISGPELDLMSLMKILVAESKQEISCFNPLPSTYQDFSVLFGQDLLTYHRGVRKEVGGALSVFDQRPDVELVPTYSACMNTSGGTLRGADFDRIAREFLGPIRTAPPLDGIYFSLHGAMAAENEARPEGWLLAETRKIVGEKIPIVVSLDLHGILTDRMLEHSDAPSPFTHIRTWIFSKQARAPRACCCDRGGGGAAGTARVQFPHWSAAMSSSPRPVLFGRIRKASGAHGTLRRSAVGGHVHRQSVYRRGRLSSNVLVVANGDAGRVSREAPRLRANSGRTTRECKPLTSLEESIRIAMETRATSCSSTPRMRPAPARRATATRSCARCWLRDTSEPRSFPSWMSRRWTRRLRLAWGDDETPSAARSIPGASSRCPSRAAVRLLSDGWFRSESHGREVVVGQTAVLEVGQLHARRHEPCREPL